MGLISPLGETISGEACWVWLSVVGPSRPHDHARAFLDRRAVPGMSAMSIIAVLGEDFVDGERLTELGASADGGMDQQRVERSPPGPCVVDTPPIG
jgi:hypothetical protein